MAKVTRKNSKAFATLNARIKELDGYTAKAGWFASSKYENGVPVATVAAVHEYGAPRKNIPPRPFMRPTVIRMADSWRRMLLSGARAILAGRSTTYDVLDAVALNAQEEIRRSITMVHEPKLKPATIAARLRKRADKKTVGLLDKPLEDTFTMYNSVNHVVERPK